jgi:two-component system nitrogen regulation sensor histidine kinase NtrY
MSDSSAAPRRRRDLLLILLTAVVFIGFLVVQIVGTNLDGGSSLTSNVTFFLLTNLNVILLVLLAFLVGRNLIRLTVDRRRGLFGSRLRTRLVILFVGMSLAPTVVMFIVARVFLNEAIDTWFETRVERALSGATEVADGHYQFAADNAAHFADTVAAQLGAGGLLRGEARAELIAVSDRLCKEFNLAHLRVFDGDGVTIHNSGEKRLVARMPPGPARLHERILAGERIAATLPLGKADVIRAGAPVLDADGRPVGGVTVDYLVPRGLARSAREITRAWDDYVQVSRLEQPLKNQYVLMLALVAMVVVFSATWVGIRQSRSITVPLLHLAEGTREVAQGNWEYRIAPATDAETGVLVDSFNRMTADLQAINGQLEERRKFAENILANITAGVVSVDQEGRLTTINRAAESMLGLRSAAVRGEHWSTVFAADDLAEVAPLIGEIVRRPERMVSRQVRLAAGEHALTALVSAMSLVDDAGSLRGVMLFFENVTDLLRVQRMEAWREVARRLAHEIKNPLTPIQLSAQRLRKRFLERLDESERRLLDECTATIVSQVEALKHLVTEFSSFARLPTAELRPESLAEVVEEALVLYREGHPEVRFRFVAGAGVPPVELDRAAIQRALINMLDNAVAACDAASGRAGEIEITATWDAAREVVSLEIADNGSGMTPEVKHRVFEPYFSTKADGTGLGMAIVAAIVADHQAYIRVSDNLPHGTRFTINFPVRGHGAAAAG